ncbi:DUF4167 domain-containing protein [Pelagibius sp.]|uniref:DUF4167 domain-containing protein n=1 Tax=Pelagibius sp. TaxID=1931238 RepID=UPI0026185D06|nr:DUF4167 domain-containing protein [Pelagibius sp.]
MRQGSNNGRRPRGRTNRKQHGGGPSRPHTFDSNGPDGRVRGNARQVYEKYLTLARDAQSAGDRVAAEAYYQHAEHYFRILSDTTDPQRPDGQRNDRRQDARNDSRTAAEAVPAPHVNGEAEETTAEALLTDQPAETRPVEVRSAETAPEDGGQHQNGSAGPRNGQDAETLMAPAGDKSDEEEAAPKPAPKRRGRPRKARSSDQESAAAKDAAPKDSAAKDSASKDSSAGDGAPAEVESDPASA